MDNTRAEMQTTIAPGPALLEVVRNEQVADRIYEMTLSGEQAAKMEQPGQFIHVKCGERTELLLRRPLSICHVDQDRRELTLIYRVEGDGTAWLAERVPGQAVDILGPLGNGFPVRHRQAGEQAVLVGGGVGVPPLYYLSKVLSAKGVQVTHILGFQSAKDVFLEQAFTELGPTFITTMDGTRGRQGLVTDVLDDWSYTQWQAMYACGPTPMLKALNDRFIGQEAYLSLEERMGCGIGACFACVCHTPDSATDYRKVCAEGPVFKIGEVSL